MKSLREDALNFQRKIISDATHFYSFTAAFKNLESPGF